MKPAAEDRRVGEPAATLVRYGRSTGMEAEEDVENKGSSLTAPIGDFFSRLKRKFAVSRARRRRKKTSKWDSLTDGHLRGIAIPVAATVAGLFALYGAGTAVYRKLKSRKKEAEKPEE